MRVTGFRTLVTPWPRGHDIGDANGVVPDEALSVSLVAVDTDVGITGLAVGGSAMLDALFPAIEGEDPRQVRALHDRMHRWVFKAGAAGATAAAIGAFDTALWDIKARDAGEPLWRLLGARDRAVAGYASALDMTLEGAELAAVLAKYKAHGLRGVKVKVGRDAVRDRERLRAASDAMGGALMIDANESWGVKEAVRRVTALEDEFDLTWVEEPVRRWDAAGLAKVSASIRSAVATGENLSTLSDFRQLLVHDAVDIVQSGTVWGITSMLLVGDLARAFDRPISVIGSPGNSFAHAAAAMPNHMLFEVQTLDTPPGITADVVLEDGHVVAGDLPGCGLEVEPDQLGAPGPPADHEASPWVRPTTAGLWQPPGR